jgi:hypothetical protein
MRRWLRILPPAWLLLPAGAIYVAFHAIYFFLEWTRRGIAAVAPDMGQPPQADQTGANTMKTTTALADALAKAFDPPASGFVGIVDNLLQLCRGGDMELAWRSNTCHVRIRQATFEERLDLPLRKGIFRAMRALPLYAISANRGSVSPYGGRGEIPLGPDPQTMFSADFVNTATEQSLRLAHLSHNGTNAANQAGGDVGSSAGIPRLQ